MFNQTINKGNVLLVWIQIGADFQQGNLEKCVNQTRMQQIRKMPISEI